MGDTITDVSVDYHGDEMMSKQMITRFNVASKKEIAGKKISELSGISAVGGASYTTQAFIDTINNL